ncbi:MAG: hypothetical protein AB7U45_14105 [Desulfamplus sp.]
MAAIYITIISIAMLNITGIGFVIFMILFNHQSDIQLKKANIKKSTTIMDTIDNKADKIGADEKTGRNGASDKKDRTGEAVIIGTAAAAAIAGSEAASGSIKPSGNFENIDDILDDLDLSEFDDLDLDDFS